MNFEPINAPIDLSDPATLIQELERNATGLIQQVEASTGATALGGHPFPAQLYGRSADCMRAAIALIQAKQLKQAPPSAPAPSPAAPPAPVRREAPKG